MTEPSHDDSEVISFHNTVDSSANYWNGEDWGRQNFVAGFEFSFDHVLFEIPIRHPRGDVE